MEEISLRELIEVLLRGKRTIIFLTILALLLGFIGTYYINTTQASAKTIISLNFQGIEKGLNPDGTKFEIDVIKSPVVINRMLNDEEFQYENLSVDGIRRNIEIAPIIPNHIVEHIKTKRAEGEDYTYYPNEYEISLGVNSNYGITKGKQH